MVEKTLSKKNKWVIAILVPVVGFLLNALVNATGLTTGVDWVKDKLNGCIYRNEYKKIEKVDLFLSWQQIYNMFGAAPYDTEYKYKGTKYRVEQFEEEKYDLNVFFDDKDNVVAYMVITKDKDFYPKIPKTDAGALGVEEARLGKLKLSDIKNQVERRIYLSSNDKFSIYQEEYEFAHYADFDTCFIGYTPKGYIFNSENKTDELATIKEKYFRTLKPGTNLLNDTHILEYRKNLIPNYFIIARESNIIEAIKAGDVELY